MARVRTQDSAERLEIRRFSIAAEQLDDEHLSAVFRGLDPSLFPATAKVADAVPIPLEEEFAFGLELILEGLSHLRGSERRRRTGSREALR